jgi:uncharacterized protein (DUF1697 family)
VATRYAALLRGINLGKAKRVPMGSLRALMTGLDFRDVRTLLNSGNVVFTGSAGRPDAIARRIQAAVMAETGVSSRVLVLTEKAFSEVVRENPLVDAAANLSRLMVAFCGDAGRLRQVRALGRQSWTPEALAVGRRAAYLWCPAGVLESPLMDAAGRLLGDTTTTRNWGTVTRIHEALRASPGAGPTAPRRMN